MRHSIQILALMLCCAAFTAQAADKTIPKPPAHPQVQMTTSLGSFTLELYPEKAPLTVKNFLGYIRSGFYQGLIFHRVITGFMIQSGGFKPGLELKQPLASIQNEASNGLKNVTGTIAMARTPNPHSATSQFFINVANNPSLDFVAKTAQGWGYAVFGKVLRGMDVVKRIEKVTTGRRGRYNDVPESDVVIKSAIVLSTAH